MLSQTSSFTFLFLLYYLVKKKMGGSGREGDLNRILRFLTVPHSKNLQISQLLCSASITRARVHIYQSTWMHLFLERYLPETYGVICFCKITSFTFSLRGNTYTIWPLFQKNILLTFLLFRYQVPRSKRSHKNFTLALLRTKRSFKNFSVTGRFNTQFEVWILINWVVIFNSSELWPFHLPEEKKESFIPILNFHKLEPTEYDKGWLFLNHEFLLPTILSGSFQLSN